jgi:hypothetical protein
MKSFQLAATVIFATTTMAMSQEKVKISYSGVVSLEQVSDLNSSENYLYGNGDVSFRWSTATDLKFGADIGIETFHSLIDDLYYDTSAYYAAGVVEGQFGKISIGMPRSVMSEYFYIPAISGSELLGVFVDFSGSVVVRSVKLFTNEDEGDLYGARYDGKIGKIDVAASVFKFSGISGNIEEIVAQYDAGHWSVTLGTTLFDYDGIFINSTSIEVQGHAGKFAGGMLYEKWDDQSDLTRAFVSYDINEVLKLNGQILHYPEDGLSDSDVYSLDLAYNHRSGAFINVGVMTSDNLFKSTDKIFAFSLGYQF